MVKRKPSDTGASDWTEPFRHQGFRGVINVGVMTPQQRAEVMTRGVRFTNMEKFVELGVQASQAQAKRARKPRRDEKLKAIARGLANRDETAKGLWPALLGQLDAAGCRPVENAIGDDPRKWRIMYTDAGDRERSVSFDTFQNMLGENKKTE